MLNLNAVVLEYDNLEIMLIGKEYWFMNQKFKIIDSHAHYDDEAFNEDREYLLNEINENGVIGILNCASSYDSLKTTDQLTKDHDFIFGALGIHPENANEMKIDTLDEIKAYIKNNDKIVAIGEIGLDYYWDENPPKDIQKDVFRRHMNLAKELNYPVVIHDRDAHQDTLEIIKEFPEVTGVVHCFSGSVEFAKECIKLGYYIGITGVVTFKNAKKVVEVVREIPLEKILVETDCPYMAPEPNRGKRNKSDYIEYIITKIAEIKNIDPYEANLRFNENFFRLIRKEK
ncbi:TatD DNase family protein [Clostridium beijerinckii]|nr:TatD DNase family protein [Clostridium beijerinckii]NYC05299.1 TatD DNase family protein [Clostridium beijerinckii]